MLSQPAGDPIISRLRPRSVQEILDHAFRLYRKYFFTFLAITAVVFVPVNLAIQLLGVALQGDTTALQRSTISGSSSTSIDALNDVFTTAIVLAIVLLVLALLGGLLQYLSQGALTSAVADSHLDRPVSFGGAYQAMLLHVGPLLGAIGLQILIGFGVFLPAIAIFLLSIGVMAGAGDSGIGAGFTFLCLGFLLMFVSFIFYLYVTVRLTVMVPAIMVENLGPVQALRRSWQLVRDYWWRTFALVLVLGIISFVISAGPAFVVTLLVGALTQSLDSTITTAVSGVVTVVAEAFFIPLQLISITLYYFDLRVRKEGFDIETAVSQRYSYPGGPMPQGAAPGGYYAGQYGQNAPVGGYAPPALGYAPQPEAPAQYPAYTQPVNPQGYQYPQGYTPQQYSPPMAETSGGSPSVGAPTLPTQPADYTVEPSSSASTVSDTGPLEAPRSEGLGFSTPSISEQAARYPGEVTGSGPSSPTEVESAGEDQSEPPRSSGDEQAPPSKP